MPSQGKSGERKWVKKGCGPIHRLGIGRFSSLVKWWYDALHSEGSTVTGKSQSWVALTVVTVLKRHKVLVYFIPE